MPLIIIDLRTSKVFCPENDDQDWSVGEKFVYLTKFLQSEDVEVINLSAAPENVGVIAYFQSTDWVARAEELIAGRSNWGTPMNPIPRTRIVDPYPDKDMMDIVQHQQNVRSVFGVFGVFERHQRRQRHVLPKTSDVFPKLGTISLERRQRL
jgi:hypothetical protein